MSWKPFQRGRGWRPRYCWGIVQAHLLKKIQVLLGAAEVFPNVKEAEGLLLADADPVLIFLCVWNSIQKDPICFPHYFLTYCNTQQLGVQDGKALPPSTQSESVFRHTLTHQSTVVIASVMCHLTQSRVREHQEGIVLLL